MPTPRETILAALYARLLALPATALRGDVLPERVPTDGLLSCAMASRESPRSRCRRCATTTSTGLRLRRSCRAPTVTPRSTL